MPTDTATWATHFEGPTEIVTTADAPAHFTARATCGEPLAEGTLVRLSLYGFRITWECDWSLDDVQLDGGGAFEITRRPPREFFEMQRLDGKHRFIMCELKVTQPIPAGATFSWSLSATAPIHANFEAPLAVYVVDPGAEQSRHIADVATLHTIAGKAVRLEVRSKPMPGDDGTVSLTAFYADAKGNPVAVDGGEITVEPCDGATGLPTAISVGSDIPCARIDCVSISGDGPVRITVRDAARDMTATTNPILAEPIDGLRVAFGALHFHTIYSGDGSGLLENAYTWLRDVLQVDVGAVTDHTPRADWQETLDINDQFNEPGRFVTIHAWEWSTRFGHGNLYLRARDTDAGPEHCNKVVGHPVEHDWPDDAVLIPHHTNIRSNEIREDGEHYWYEFKFDKHNARMKLFEIIQTRGNFESDTLDDEWGIVTGDIGASLQDALAAGHRLGVVSGTDNHSSFPTRDANNPGHYVGMTGFLVPELSRDAVWEAMDQRRTFGTSGVPIICHATFNGDLMGSELKAPAGKPVTLSARLHGTDVIDRVQVISDRNVVWEDRPGALDAVYDGVQLPACSDGGYYYLRMLQRDGHRAWSSPVWVDHT